MTDNYKIVKWNYLRNNLVLSSTQLETDMFNEEYREWVLAMKDLLDAVIPTAELFSELIDAYCDMEFVLIGSKAKGDFDARKDRILEYTYKTTFDTLTHFRVRNPGVIISQAQEVVIAANEDKPLTKTEGKVKKGSDWKDPKVEIANIVRKHMTI